MRRGASKAPGASSGRMLPHRSFQAASTSVVDSVDPMLAAGGLMELHGHRRCSQARTLRLSADILPLLRSETSSKPTF